MTGEYSVYVSVGLQYETSMDSTTIYLFLPELETSSQMFGAIRLLPQALNFIFQRIIHCPKRLSA